MWESKIVPAITCPEIAAVLYCVDSVFLCGPLRISAFSALKLMFIAENAEIRRGPPRKTLLRHLGELVGEGVDDELETIRDAEFGIDRAEVMRNRRRTDEESFRNLTIL